MRKHSKHMSLPVIGISLPTEQNWFEGSSAFTPDYDRTNNDSSCGNTM